MHPSCIAILLFCCFACLTNWKASDNRYENTERRAELVAKKGIRYMGMGVSGGEEGARNGASC